MAFLQRQRTQIRDTSVTANVPNSDVAKLMYYLNCVCYCIDYNDSDIHRYTNYSNCTSLSDKEDKVVFALAATLSPDIFLGKVFFPSNALCGDNQNRFFEISEMSDQLLVASSLIIGGRRCRVNKIMTLKQIWLEENYIGPVRRLNERFRPKPRPVVQSKPTQSSTCTIL